MKKKKWLALLTTICLAFTVAQVSTAADGDGPGFANVRDVQSNITTTPTMISFVDSQDDYDRITTSSPGTAIFRLSAEGKATDTAGRTIATLDELYGKLDNRVIAAFIPASKVAVDALAGYCAQKGIEDVAVASSDTELIRYAHEKYYLFRGIVIIDKTDYSEAGLLKIREKVNANHAKIALLPYGATREAVEYLQKLFVTVWIGEADTENDKAFMTQILSGANGIVVSDRAAAEKCFTSYFKEDSFTRQILIIGHRGLPSKAPENSIESARLAFEAGADYVENDVYITKDNVVVVMHDGQIDRTANGTGYIETMTYEKLQQYTLKPVGGLENCKIPSLEDYFREFGDQHIVIEIKSTREKLIPAMIELIKKYDMSSKINFISFNTEQLARIKEQAPEISAGYLCSGLTSADNPLGSVEAAVKATQRYGTTFNQSAVDISQEFVTQLSHRGVTFWPWTYNEKAMFTQQFFWGLNGMTTNYSNWAGNTAKTIRLGSDPGTATVGQNIPLDFTAVAYNGAETKLGDDAEIVVIDGGDRVTRNGNRLTAKAEGEVSLYCRYKTAINGKSMYACSDIVTFSIKAGSGVTPPESSDPPVDASSAPEGSGSESTDPAESSALQSSAAAVSDTASAGNAGTSAAQSDASTSTKGGGMTIFWIVLGIVLVVAAGAAATLIILKKKGILSLGSKG